MSVVPEHLCQKINKVMNVSTSIELCAGSERFTTVEKFWAFKNEGENKGLRFAGKYYKYT